ncbi:MAG: hypothetical protein AAF632_15090 [Bacteroidota bacterium]
MKIFDYFKNKNRVDAGEGKRPGAAYKLWDVGFHGDKHLLNLVDYLMQQEVRYFIETGSNVGTTLTYVANQYPSISCLSCEPDKTAFEHALINTKNFSNVTLFNLLSQDLIREIDKNRKELYGAKTMFWLDAHSYGFDWPLKDEIRFIARNFLNAYILIDDFKVPEYDCFGYDTYKDQVCAHEFIKDDFGGVSYQLFYPAYTERTSYHHPLQGWGLYVIGENFTPPAHLQHMMREEKAA